MGAHGRGSKKLVYKALLAKWDNAKTARRIRNQFVFSIKCQSYIDPVAPRVLCFCYFLSVTVPLRFTCLISRDSLGLPARCSVSIQRTMNGLIRH